MVAVASSGINFKAPWQFYPYAVSVANLQVYDAGDSFPASSLVAFFTEMARRGIQDTTNWTAGTYKTLLSVSGKGEVANLVGCTAGGAETTTFELTVDGVLTEIAVPVALGQRALLTRGLGSQIMFTTANAIGFSKTEALSATKDYFTEGLGTTSMLLPWWGYGVLGTPMLQFNTSLLVRAKHSASITNSTATAYSAVMYRKGL